MARRSKNKKSEKEESKLEEQNPETATMDSPEPEVESEGTEEDFEQKFMEMNDKFLRLYSEFENFRRRTAKEKIDLMSNAKGESLSNMLPIIDDFERAIANNENTEELEALREGFKLIHTKLTGTLGQAGLKAMETEAGDDFDTDKHEAITQIPAPSEELKGKVVDIIEKGYVINEKVVRYAKVVIGS